MTTETVSWIGMGMCLAAFLFGWFLPDDKRRGSDKHRRTKFRGGSVRSLSYGIILCFLAMLPPFTAHAGEMDVKVIHESSGYKYICIDGIVFLENKNGNLVQLLLNKPVAMGGTAVAMECVPCNKLNEWLKYYRK